MQLCGCVDIYVQVESAKYLHNMCLFRRILRMHLCPKALLCNISEFVPVKELFTLGKHEAWSGKQLADTFIVARGVRGREGVQLVLEFCKKHAPQWEDTSYLCQFIDTFENKWCQEVQRTGKLSALSHQEHHHAGFSGMNFVETLKDKNNQVFLFGANGVASRLASFFEEPHLLDAKVLLNFYKELVKVPICMTPRTYFVQIQGARLLGKKHKKEECEDG